MAASNLQFYSLNISSPQGPVLPQSLLSDNDPSSADIYYLQGIPVTDAPNITASLEKHHFSIMQIPVCWPKDDGKHDYTTMQSFLAFRTHRFTGSQISHVVLALPRIHWSYQVIDNNTQRAITISHLQLPSEITASRQARFTLNVEIEAPVNDVSRNNFSIETVDNQPEGPVLNLDAAQKNVHKSTHLREKRQHHVS